MAIERQIRVETSINASVDAVWARVADHEATPSWISEVKRVRITEPGAETRGGQGAVREVAFKPRLWTTILERIIVYRPGERFHYVLFSGMPGLLHHEGRVIVAPAGSGATLRWEVDFRFRSLHWFRPFVPSFVRQFEGVLQGGLAELKRQLESSPAEARLAAEPRA
jgi:Polyketide cyclase / dehydrase and lipid transport